MDGRLILFGNLLGESPNGESLFAPRYKELVGSLDGMIAESDRGARRFLSYFRDSLSKPTHQIPVALFRKKTDPSEINFLLEPIESGEVWGYVSDGGLPCVADPGHLLVQRCRKKGIGIEACLGPSSIFYALVLSGFDGNCFSFNGYFPKEPVQRAAQIQKAEKRASIEKSVQIYIEAPYRGWAALETLLETLDEKRTLCVAKNLMLPNEEVMVHSVAKWREKKEALGKEPAVFLFI